MSRRDRESVSFHPTESSAGPEQSDAVDLDGRDQRERRETPTERLDRNWGDLIQELRVVQTGVQFLTGFLLTLPFQQQFGRLDSVDIDIYLTTICASIAATVFLQTPVSVHRALFRRHQRREAVALAHRMAVVGLLLLSVAITGVAALIFDVVVNRVSGVIAAVITVGTVAVLWVVVPLGVRGRPTNTSDI
ncbi:DUF6328 family protein [Williamsia sterculiae]|uniref:Sodium:proton antiporter n=1 Tax=Williamsia sterculiae TaxID=1344003 RepID=A0A1N7DLK7_9NOCA|nr:DUF6328 family protein [Williamsia sterculiae]SIR76714.1 hypothetical protein SAMN05445060_0739 [Williamsia sterculiae]